MSGSKSTLGELQLIVENGRTVIHGPPSSPGSTENRAETRIEPTVAALRDLVRFDDFGRYRPLSGARTLRTGWRLECGTDDGLTIDQAIDIAYPLASEHVALHAAGALTVVSLEETLRRQTGRYAVARELSPEGRVIAQDVLCARCVREPIWSERDVAMTPGAIPCPEPCSVMVSLCREAALWEREPPPNAMTDPAVAWAAFDVPGNELRRAYLAAQDATGQADGPSDHCMSNSQVIA